MLTHCYGFPMSSVGAFVSLCLTRCISGAAGDLLPVGWCSWGFGWLERSRVYRLLPFRPLPWVLQSLGGLRWVSRCCSWGGDLGELAESWCSLFWPIFIDSHNNSVAPFIQGSQTRLKVEFTV